MNLPIIKNLVSVILLMIATSGIMAQEVAQVRQADLMEGGYAISGQAFLEILDDGTLRLRFSDDYTTPRGPDVQLFLSNHPTQVGSALFVTNLAEEGAFSGAHSWTLDSDINLNDYNYVILRCVQFGLHWAGGTFGMAQDAGGNMGGDDCLSSGVATTNWVDTVQICPTDGNDDIIPLKNTISAAAGSTYAYVITDNESKILQVVRTDEYNFEGSGTGTFRVYGISFTGILSYNQGDDWQSIQSTECIEFSNPEIFLTVLKDGCNALCEATAVATTNWVSRVDICPSDGTDDIIPLKNTLSIPAGNTYAYVITNIQGDIISVHKEDSFNFEGSSNITNRVYGISYTGALTYLPGDTWNTIRSDGCIEFSDPNIYLTVTKNACVAEPECFETNVASTAWQTDFSICPDDGESDSIFLQNNLFIAPGETYAFVRTDENQRIKELILEEWFDFEGSGMGQDRIYGISYEGTLSDFTPGDLLSTLTADGCATISSQELFIKVTKDGCAASVGSISGKVSNYNGDGVGNVRITLNTGASTTTNSDGVYTFNDLPLGSPYTLTPSRDDNYSNGLSAQDLVIIQRHILGIQQIENSFLFIAGDANKDDRISALDVINFLNLIIGRTTELPNNTSWRFIPGTKSFDNGEDPFDFVEKDAVQNLTGDVTNLNFTAVKTGDVSGNAR